MDAILQVKDLCKKYDGFALDHVSFTLPRGCIMGFIGENGAGKSTTIKAILNLIHRDQGEIQIFGKDNIQNELEVKEQIGVVFDTLNLPEMLQAQDVGKMMCSRSTASGTRQNTRSTWNSLNYRSKKQSRIFPVA